MSEPTKLPDVAEGRLAASSFSSGLSVSDFAACIDMGLEPVGLAQGYCAVRTASSVYFANAQQGGLGRSISPFQVSAGDYVENYQCPHGMVSAEHRMWGQNYQQPWIEATWKQGFTNAYARMVKEATTLGAHGVVGVVDNVSRIGQEGILEFSIRGTAVRVPGLGVPSGGPWTTYLAGQRLAKIIEAGFAPVSIVAAVSSVRVWASCITEYLMEGSGMTMWVQGAESTEVEQIVSARTAARSLVRDMARQQLQGDQLHGVELRVREHEYAKGDLEIQPVLRGNRIRRFKDFDPMPVPRLTVRLS
jgi:uncharacterized protein YbjQ (UPF0145 family)